MEQYAICGEYLNDIEKPLQNTDCNECQFGLIAPNTESVEQQDEAEGPEDSPPDANENYVLSGIPLTSFYNCSGNTTHLFTDSQLYTAHRFHGFRHALFYYTCKETRGNNVRVT